MLKIVEYTAPEEIIESTEEELIECECEQDLTEFERYTDEILFLIKMREDLTVKEEIKKNTLAVEAELQKYENTTVVKFIHLIAVSNPPEFNEEDSILIELNGVIHNYIMGCKIARNEELTFEDAVRKLGINKYEAFKKL